jgi:hypothetical protein
MLFKKIASFALLAAGVSAYPPKGVAFDHVFIIFLENTVCTSIAGAFHSDLFAIHLVAHSSRH